MMNIKKFFGILLAVFVSATSAYADGDGVPKFIGFGDSLMDVGNDFVASAGIVPPATRYAPGRFSNGPIMLEYLTSDVCIEVKPSLVADLTADSCVSYAWGGSTTGISSPTPGGGFEVPGLLGQVNIFAQDIAGAIDPGTTIVVWTGANDLIFGPSTPTEAAENIATALEAFVGLGATNIVVLNLPNLSQLPLAGDDAGGLQHAVRRFNSKLKKIVGGINESAVGVNLTLVDTSKPFKKVLKNPEVFGFSADISAGPASGCLFSFVYGLAPDCSPLSPDTFTTNRFFWDEVHITSQVHQLISVITRGAVTGTLTNDD